MTRQEIPDYNHVVRTVGKAKWDVADDGKTVLIESDEFLPREDHPPGTGPEDCVSVDWLEYFSGNLREQLNKVRDAVSTRGRTVGRQARLATILVDHVHKAAKTENRKVVVSTTDDDDDPSHSGIYGLDPLDHKIAQEIARQAVAYPAFD